jgi:hypothetical protein
MLEIKQINNMDRQNPVRNIRFGTQAQLRLRVSPLAFDSFALPAGGLRLSDHLSIQGYPWNADDLTFTSANLSSFVRRRGWRS